MTIPGLLRDVGRAILAAAALIVLAWLCLTPRERTPRPEAPGAGVVIHGPAR